VFEPNLYTTKQKEGIYGLHKFRDGAIYLVMQHSSGDWFTIKPASEREEKWFAYHGDKVNKVSR
jgi:hypothetical protein